MHPDDDPAAIDPLDAENRWSYTVFLQALGKYLEYRAERGLIDAHYEYARAVLLNYAMWMCANERPYLETPEKLEFPNETWAAQDIRKAAVFEFAARHATDDGTRACFLARADGFVDYAIGMLTQGANRHADAPAGVAAGVWIPAADARARRARRRLATVTAFQRHSFTPLRQRLAKRLAWAGAGLSAAAVLVIVLLIS